MQLTCCGRRQWLLTCDARKHGYSLRQCRCRPTANRPLPRCLQANEQRYRLLEGKHTALVAEKDKLFQENETLRQVGALPAALWLCFSRR